MNRSTVSVSPTRDLTSRNLHLFVSSGRRTAGGGAHSQHVPSLDQFLAEISGRGVGGGGNGSCCCRTSLTGPHPRPSAGDHWAEEEEQHAVSALSGQWLLQLLQGQNNKHHHHVNKINIKKWSLYSHHQCFKSHIQAGSVLHASTRD